MMKSIVIWLLATAIVISGSIANAQQAEKIFRIGFLDSSTSSGMTVLMDVFLRGRFSTGESNP